MDKYFGNTWKDDLRARADIVQVVSSYVQLKRNGHKYIGLCPFHNEKTPSFNVDPERNVYYCFGCKNGGDVFRFTMEIERCGFMEAVKILADRYNFSVPDQEYTYNPSWEKIKADSDRLYAVNAAAADLFHDTLYMDEGEKARAYLKKRGLDDITIKKFKLGAAPNRKDYAIKHLVEQGFKLTDIYDAGLASGDQEKPYDMFRHRLIIPIIDKNDRVMGFGGRILSNGNPKYLNTKETLVFSKGSGVFPANILRRTRNVHHLILVEGYFDVMMLTQHEYTGVIATLGTAVTPIQARYLKKFSDNIYIAFDGDEAGRTATEKALDVFNKEGLLAKVLCLPEGMDPDTLVNQNGRAAFDAIKPVGPDKYRMIQKQRLYDLTTGEGRADYVKDCVNDLVKVKDPVDLSLLLSDLSLQTGFSQDVIEKQMSTVTTVGAERSVTSFASPTRKPPSLQVSENTKIQQTLLSLLISGKIDQDILNEKVFDDPVMKSLYQALSSGASPSEMFDLCEPAMHDSVIQILSEDVSDLTEDETTFMTHQCIVRLEIIGYENQLDLLTASMRVIPQDDKNSVYQEIAALTKTLEQLKSKAT